MLKSSYSQIVSSSKYFTRVFSQTDRFLFIIIQKSHTLLIADHSGTDSTDAKRTDGRKIHRQEKNRSAESNGIKLYNGT